MNKKSFLNLTFVLVVLIFLPLQSLAKPPITVGKGIWLNIWNYPANPEIFCEQLKSKGIDTIYLQISRSNTPAIKEPVKLNRIIKSAHERNINVIGWTYSFLKEPISDAHKFIQAVNYRTPDGDKLDGLAADIEEVTNSRAIEMPQPTQGIYLVKVQNGNEMTVIRMVVE